MKVTRYDLKSRNLVLEFLESRPSASIEISEQLGLNTQTALRYTAALHEDKKIHISGWLRRSNRWLPVYSAGKGEDKPEPLWLPNCSGKAEEKIAVIKALLATQNLTNKQICELTGFNINAVSSCLVYMRAHNECHIVGFVDRNGKYSTSERIHALGPGENVEIGDYIDTFRVNASKAMVTLPKRAQNPFSYLIDAAQ